jgi:putative phage-type endonuclease
MTPQMIWRNLMKTLVSTLNMPHSEWLKWRKKGIGGSDAATVVCLNPYSSLLSLYADKLGLLPEKEDNEQMRQGRDLEQYVAERFMEATGKKVARFNRMLVHPDHPWMLADVDRLVVGEDAILECKTTSVYNKSDFENGEIPLYYYVQVQHYLAVSGRSVGYLAVLVLNRGFYWFTINADEQEQVSLIAAEEAFCNNHVLSQVPPDPDGSDSAYEAIQALTSPNDEPTGETLLYDMDSDIARLLALQEQMKPMQTESEAIKQKIALSMGESAYGKSNIAKVSYLTQYRKAHMVKASVSRKLRVTALKG